MSRNAASRSTRRNVFAVIEHLSALRFQTRRSRLYQIAARIALREFEQAQKLARARRFGHAVRSDNQTCARTGMVSQSWVLEKLMQRLVEAPVPE